MSAGVIFRLLILRFASRVILSMNSPKRYYYSDGHFELYPFYSSSSSYKNQWISSSHSY